MDRTDLAVVLVLAGLLLIGAGVWVFGGLAGLLWYVGALLVFLGMYFLGMAKAGRV